MAIQTSILRPGLLVSLKTSISGNVSYRKQDIEADHETDTGERRAKWETERTISDPIEHERAVKARGKARSAVTSICAFSAFGLLCPEAAADELDKAIAEAREIADAFNASARLTRIKVYVITGRIAPDDVEAVRAINSEVRDLLADMERGIQNLDVKTVREAAGKAKSIGAMLSPEAQVRVQLAVDAARSAARRMVQAGDQAAQEIDKRTLRAISEARTAFLDLDDAPEVAAPTAIGRAVDFEPPVAIQAAPTAGPAFIFDL